MDATAIENAEVALLGLYLSLAERNGHDVAQLFAEIPQTSTAHAASEGDL